MKWLGLGAGRRELKELEKTTIDKGIFIKIRVCMWEGRRESGHQTINFGAHNYKGQGHLLICSGP